MPVFKLFRSNSNNSSKPTNKLYALISKKSWNDALDRCIKSPQDVQYIMSDTSKHGAVHSISVLQQAALLHAPVDLIQRVIEAYPRAVFAADHKRGRTFLHRLVCKGKDLPERTPFTVSKIIDTIFQNLSEDEIQDLMNARDSEFGRTVLHDACFHGADLCVMKSLLRCSGTEEVATTTVSGLLMAQDYAGSTPIHLACRKNASLEVLDFLLAQEDGKIALLTSDNNGCTPLHKTCSNKKAIPEIVRLILAMSSDDEHMALVQCSRGMTALHIACRNKASYGVVKLLFMAAPSAVEVGDITGCTPKDCAFGFNADPDVLELLSRHKPKASRTTSMGFALQKKKNIKIGRRTTL